MMIRSTLLKNVSILKNNLLKALEDPAKTYYLWLNDELYEFDTPTIDVSKEANEIQLSKIAESLDTSIMSHTHENTLKTFLSNMEGLISKTDKTEIEKKDIDWMIDESLDIFEKSMADSQIFLYNARKMQLEKDIARMEETKASIDRRAQFRTNLLFTSMFGACVIELLVAYYCIYEVEWLGWDIVEPVTYTIAQGKFVVGTYFFWKYLCDTSWTDLNDHYNRRFSKKMFAKADFKLERLLFYKKQLEEINTKISQLERSKMY